MSSIQWTDETWNPVTGCAKVSQGCKHCYAETWHERFHQGNVTFARQAGHPSPAAARAAGVDLPCPPQYDHPFDVVQLHPERLTQPLHWRKPRRVFVDSMSDLFHPDVPDEFIDQVFAVMALSPRHTFQLLTKRPERMREYLGNGHGLSVDRFHRWATAADALKPGVTVNPETFAGIFGGGLVNVWLGVSTEDQRAADERIPILLDTPAAVRFISAEPLLGPIELTRELVGDLVDWLDGTWVHLRTGIVQRAPHLDWVIAGGESGRGARPFDIAWARSLRDHCAQAGVPFFLKQLGANAIISDRQCTGCAGPRPQGRGTTHQLGTVEHGPGRYYTPSPKGDVPAEWPPDLRESRAYPSRGTAVPA